MIGLQEAITQEKHYDEFAANVSLELENNDVVCLSIPVNLYDRELISSHSIGASTKLGYEFFTIADTTATAAENLLKAAVARYEKDYALQHSFVDFKSAVFTINDGIRNYHAQLIEVPITVESQKLLFPILFRFPLIATKVKMLGVYLVKDKKDTTLLPGQLVMRD
jgi:hypothetical protein